MGCVVGGNQVMMMQIGHWIVEEHRLLKPALLLTKQQQVGVFVLRINIFFCHFLQIATCSMWCYIFHHQPEWNPYNLLLSLSPMFLYVCLDLDFVFSNFSVARARCIILENWEDDQNRKTRPFYLHLDCLFSYLNPERAGTESPFRILLFWQLCSAVIMSPCM